ncbi:Protein F31C3.2 a [Aphelenchoides avenae]|nr:Protein F31C3.2 a [Aphelenchus avenae]
MPIPSWLAIQTGRVTANPAKQKKRKSVSKHKSRWKTNGVAWTESDEESFLDEPVPACIRQFLQRYDETDMLNVEVVKKERSKSPTSRTETDEDDIVQVASTGPSSSKKTRWGSRSPSPPISGDDVRRARAVSAVPQRLQKQPTPPCSSREQTPTRRSPSPERRHKATEQRSAKRPQSPSPGPSNNLKLAVAGERRPAKQPTPPRFSPSSSPTRSSIASSNPLKSAEHSMHASRQHQRTHSSANHAIPRASTAVKHPTPPRTSPSRTPTGSPVAVRIPIGKTVVSSAYAARLERSLTPVGSGQTPPRNANRSPSPPSLAPTTQSPKRVQHSQQVPQSVAAATSNQSTLSSHSACKQKPKASTSLEARPHCPRNVSSDRSNDGIRPKSEPRPPVEVSRPSGSRRQGTSRSTEALQHEHASMSDNNDKFNHGIAEHPRAKGIMNDVKRRLEQAKAHARLEQELNDMKTENALGADVIRRSLEVLRVISEAARRVCIALNLGAPVVHKIGSQSMMCATTHSHLDLLIVPGDRVEQPADNNFLCALKAELERYQRLCMKVSAQVSPVMAISVSNKSSPGADLSVFVRSDADCLRGSYLLKAYASIDTRFSSLCIVIKDWFHRRGYSGHDGYLSGYAVTLMLVHYLQCGVSPPVLPNLSALCARQFRSDRPLQEISMNESPPKMPEQSWFEKNHASLVELLIGFFAYYRHFDYALDVIGIKGAVGRRRQSEDVDATVVIEDPYSRLNVADEIDGTKLFHLQKSIKDFLEDLFR